MFGTPREDAGGQEAKTPHKGKETPTFPTPEKAQKEGLSQAEIGSQTVAVLELLVAHNATRPDGMTFGWEQPCRGVRYVTCRGQTIVAKMHGDLCRV